MRKLKTFGSNADDQSSPMSKVGFTDRSGVSFGTNTNTRSQFGPNQQDERESMSFVSNNLFMTKRTDRLNETQKIQKNNFSDRNNFIRISVMENQGDNED